jgi:preprotein translocase subunit YajC
LKTFVLLAQTKPIGQPTAPPAWTNYLPILLGLLVLYFFVFRSKRGEEKKRQQMLDTLKRGDRVQTIGGILGTVLEAKDNEVVVKVDESTNTKMRFTRSAIHRVIQEEKSEGK